MSETRWYVDPDTGKVVKGKTPKSKGRGRDTTIRAEEFRNPTLAEYELTSPSQAPSNTTDPYNTGANSTSTPRGGGGGGGNTYANMLKALQQLSQMSQQTINTSMDDLTRTLQAQTNPFSNFQAQSTQTTPELATLLQSQGVQQDPLQQYAAAINAQNTGQAKAFGNMTDVLSGIQTRGQEGMIADVGQQRANLLNALQGNIMGAGVGLMGKKTIPQNNIIQLLLAGLKNRA
jgi:hypothetical protein